MKKQTKRPVKNKAISIVVLLLLLICAQYIFMRIYTTTKEKAIITEVSKIKALASNSTDSAVDPNEGKYLRLTEVPYMTQSNTAYGKIRLNKADDNGTKIAVKREGAYYTFDNGIFAHANSNVYYDIREYSQKYHYLTMYVGLNQTSSKGDGVKFWVYTSNDDTFHTTGSQYWTTKENLETNLTEVDILPGQNAVFVKIDISGAKYLRLQANQKSSNAQDHSVYVDPMLITDDYVPPVNRFPEISVYDQRIKDYADEKLGANPNYDLLSDENYEYLVLQRKFVSSLGNYALQRFVDENPDNQATIDWLMDDVENLRYYILGGAPSGTYFNSLNVLTRLLKEYKSDFDVTEEISANGKATLTKRDLPFGTTKGELYKRMAISISLTHSTGVRLWMQNSSTNQSDAVIRYRQYKYMYDNGMFKATDAADITPWFETYTIEEMRYVMNVALDDEEVIWLNEYTQSKIDEAPARAWSLLTPHSYIAYVWPNYQNAVYYADENYEYFNDLFGVPQKDAQGNLIRDEDGNVVKKLLWPDKENPDAPNYGISRSSAGEPYIYKLWMNLRNKFGTGAVCGGISKLGHCIRGSHAIPSGVIGQPGHAAIIYYTQNSNGDGYWGIDNDVSGWTKSEKGERLLLGWGNDGSYVKGYNIPYIALGQEALNDYNNLVKAEEILMTEPLYETNAEKEAVYNKAIEAQSFNLDAWAGLVKLYLADSTKTEEDYYRLAERMMDNLKYFPFTMANLADKIKVKFTNDEYVFKFTLLYTRMLEYGKGYPNNGYEGEGGAKVVQPSLTRTLATSLLGQMDTSLARFSFDGADAGKIVLGSRFDGSIVRWDYSLDGKQTWKEADLSAQSDDHKQTLTQTELNSITSENDIYVHIVGANYAEENLYKIDILESAGLPSTLYANDNENRVVGVNLSTEWRYTENEPWTSYGTASPDLTGERTVQLRQGATGTRLASSDIATYTFHTNNDPDTRKYVPVSHLSLQSVSTQATSNGGAAVNAIDANYNTRYHSAWNGSDSQRFMVIKLDEPMYISAVEFVPAGGGNGKIIDGTIYGSMTTDDDSWKELSKQTNLRYSNAADTVAQAVANTKGFEIEEAKREKVQYIKIVANRASNGNWFTARAFNFYQDITINPVVAPTASIAYSTTERTNEPVIARLVNASTDITITNNEGKDTYVFTENGEFTFTFIDANENEGSVTARVDWIDSKVPSADVTYELGEDSKLKAILENISEDVYLLDSNNNKTNFIEVGPNGVVESISYFDQNGNTYKIAELDEDKFTTKITYTNTISEVPEVKYYVTAFEKASDGTTTTTRLYYDAEGNTIEVDESKKAILRGLEEARSNPLEIYLENEQEYEFKLLDTASNIAYKNIKVDFIENNTKILASDITYSTTMTTNQNVVATINPYVIDLNNTSYEVEIVRKKENVDNNDNPNENTPKVDPYEVIADKTYTFTQNGNYTFSYRRIKTEDEKESEKQKDVGLDMEVESHTARVDWIDKTAPTAEIRYSTTSPTNGEVTATLVNESETIVITNNGTNRDYTFTENGEFKFKFVDIAGNEGEAIARVDWINKNIDEEFRFSSEKYTIANGYISGISAKLNDNAGTTVNGFKANVNTNQKLTFLDNDGMELGENDLVTTGTRVKVGENVEYTLLVTGDIDGDGEVTVNDLAQIKLHCINLRTLEGVALKAADLDQDGEITVNDIAVLKLAIIGFQKLD